MTYDPSGLDSPPTMAHSQEKRLTDVAEERTDVPKLLKNVKINGAAEHKYCTINGLAFDKLTGPLPSLTTLTTKTKPPLTTETERSSQRCLESWDHPEDVPFIRKRGDKLDAADADHTKYLCGARNCAGSLWTMLHEVANAPFARQVVGDLFPVVDFEFLGKLKHGKGVADYYSSVQVWGCNPECLDPTTYEDEDQNFAYSKVRKKLAEGKEGPSSNLDARQTTAVNEVDLGLFPSVDFEFLGKLKLEKGLADCDPNFPVWVSTQTSLDDQWDGKRTGQQAVEVRLSSSWTSWSNTTKSDTSRVLHTGSA
ncbi:hypothetical protein FN846DRAFT_1024075 [Sphaerosporella brunnea]|uniref:Uncharacterized protein n=1 Tax=Sphaerosporella brunnea TaxID=1250544 RepID=A0A5J5EKB2_9PEZI|nr:hypothetical protein FN846DRAFT_1024075 [Sphaerosporella brunnea]